MTHLTREDIERWWQAGNPAERERVIGHLAECDRCVQLYASVVDELPGAGSPRVAPAEAIPLGRRLYRGPAAPRRGRPAWRPAYLLAGGLAAVLIAVVVLVPSMREPSALPDTAGVRGTRVQLLEPAGTVAAPFVFRWASPLAAPRFRLDIDDADGVRVHSETVDGDARGVTDASALGLVSGVEYRWQVVALDANGRELIRSEPQPFVVGSPVR